MTSNRDEIVDRLRREASRVAASYGLDLFDLQFRRESIGWVLRVIIERPAAGAGVSEGAATADEAAGSYEDTVGIDDCQRVSQDLSALLDVDDELGGELDRYTLEVSSPGLDRPLRGEADYRRFAGRLAKIVTTEPVNGQSHFAGRLMGLDGGDIVVGEGRRVHRVPLALVRRARLDVEF